MATVSSGSRVFGGYAPSGSSNFISAASQGIGSLYSGVPSRPDWMGGTKPGQEAYGPVIQGTMGSYRKLAGGGYVDQYGEKVSGFSRPSTSRVSGGGGGGGGGVTVIPPTPLEFYMGKPPELQKLEFDYTQMGKRVQEANLPTIEEYKRATPGEEATLRALSQSAADYAAGKIPKTVLEQTQQSIAQAGYGTGLGVGGGRRAGGIQKAYGARDILTTSLGLQQQAQQMAAAIPQILQQRYAAQYQVSPTQVFDTAVSQASINQQLANQQAMMNWMAQPLPGQYDITTGSYVGFGAPGTRVTSRPLAPGIGTNYTGSAYNPFA